MFLLKICSVSPASKQRPEKVVTKKPSQLEVGAAELAEKELRSKSTLRQNELLGCRHENLTASSRPPKRHPRKDPVL